MSRPNHIIDFPTPSGGGDFLSGDLPIISDDQGVKYQERFVTDGFGEQVRVMAFSPDNETIEDNGRPAVIFAPGFSLDTYSLHDSMTMFAKLGQKAVTIDRHRYSQPQVSPHDHMSDSLGAVIDTMSYESGMPVGLMAYSQGGVYSVPVALDDLNRKPDERKIDSMTMIAPAGVIDQSFLTLAGRAAFEMATHVDPREICNNLAFLKQSRHMAKYILANLPLALEEGYDISKTRTAEQLFALKAGGLALGVIGFGRDRIIPPAFLKMQLSADIPYREVEKAKHTSIMFDRRTIKKVQELHEEFADGSALLAA